MARQSNTRRQKDISRMLREKRKAYPDKLKSQQGKWQGKAKRVNETH